MPACVPEPRRARRRARRALLRCGLLVSVGIAALGTRSEAATPPPFSIDVDRTTAVFQLSNLAPGPLGFRCLLLSVRNGTADAAYLSATVGGTGLAAYLDLTVDVGTSADPTTCTDFAGTTAFAGTVDQLGTDHAAPTSGVVLPIADGRSAVVRFTLALRSDNAAQGRTATLALRFDAQDTTPVTPTTTVAPTTVAPTTVAPTTTPTTTPTSAPATTMAPSTSVGPTTSAAPTTSTTVAASTTTTATGAVVDDGVTRRGAAGRTGTTGAGRATTTAVTVLVPAPSGTIEVRDPTRAPAERTAAEQAVQVVAQTVSVAARTSSVPALFVAFVFAFLVVQDRFDRNDPKLARAPLTPDPELVFQPRRREWAP